jgi:hypothetical protein
VVVEGGWVWGPAVVRDGGVAWECGAEGGAPVVWVDTEVRVVAVLVPAGAVTALVLLMAVVVASTPMVVVSPAQLQEARNAMTKTGISAARRRAKQRKSQAAMSCPSILVKTGFLRRLPSSTPETNPSQERVRGRDLTPAASEVEAVGAAAEAVGAAAEAVGAWKWWSWKEAAE